jgi:hypothetical protein
MCVWTGMCMCVPTGMCVSKGIICGCARYRVASVDVSLACCLPCCLACCRALHACDCAAKAVVPNVHLSDGLVDILAVKKEGGGHLQLIKASYKQFLATGNSDEVTLQTFSSLFVSLPPLARVVLPA